jgi:hypothetical protein
VESSSRTANPRYRLNTQDPGRGGSLLYCSVVDRDLDSRSGCNWARESWIRISLPIPDLHPFPDTILTRNKEENGLFIFWIELFGELEAFS